MVRNGYNGGFHIHRKIMVKMMEQTKTDWRAIIDNLQQPPLQFWIDFGKFIAATQKGDDSDARWEKLVYWAGILMGRYNNSLANHIVLKYLDCLGKQDR